MEKTLTTIEAARKGNNIVLTAYDADGEQAGRVTVYCDDIRELYGVSCPAWFEDNQDNENALWELYHSIAGIRVSE